jgi:hypothetical protein
VRRQLIIGRGNRVYLPSHLEQEVGLESFQDIVEKIRSLPGIRRVPSKSETNDLTRGFSVSEPSGRVLQPSSSLLHDDDLSHQRYIETPRDDLPQNVFEPLQVERVKADASNL